MKILFITNVPSPYRVDFFNELGQLAELTVCYERESASDRAKNWKGSQALHFQEVFSGNQTIGTDRSIGFGLIKEVRKRSFDFLIISGYASPAVIMLIVYCKLNKVPYCIESDGGFNKKDKKFLYMVKRFLLRKAYLHFTTCDEHIDYLKSLGVRQDRIIKYPFTSLMEKDILPDVLTLEQKQSYRQQLQTQERYIVISVGRFIHGKGYDVLLQAACRIDQNIGIYIIGGTPTEEYLTYKRDNNLEHVHFVDFMSKNELKTWYYAADAFVLPTRKDVWGLVINEAMAAGLPVVTTDRCIAGLELVEEGQNGYIVPVEDDAMLAEMISQLFDNREQLRRMSRRSLETIKPYTIENMAQRHYEVLKAQG